MRSIPASAGNPRGCRRAAARGRVHPRERGESSRRPGSLHTVTGPSPRARGILVMSYLLDGERGSIPASAGNPKVRSISRISPRVHPRERGESGLGRGRGRGGRGPSPRARGILQQRRAHPRRAGSIPASAGNPASTPGRPGRARVHPRERGESDADVADRAVGAGPSPRARGIPGPGAARERRARSIPASAGNPAALPAAGARPWVHPRERGESQGHRIRGRGGRGPSPRARGIPALAFRIWGGSGSIPASAGNPAWRGWSSREVRVHPRERGESRRSHSGSGADPGPSPRARGIPGRAQAAERQRGSIPASAGNPRWRAARRWGPRVHPRERGESCSERPARSSAAGPSPRARGIPAVWLSPRRGEGQGPSPRARGIPRSRAPHLRHPRSIPASAGNPTTATATSRASGVHPRERGESHGLEAAAQLGEGPSPRARGIRSWCRPAPAPGGSIPASAGNPVAAGDNPFPSAVHPRERGESGTPAGIARALEGPSPRARGIQETRSMTRSEPGSIPASAGNPRRWRRRSCSGAVHPRERGESSTAVQRSGAFTGPSPRARGILQRHGPLRRPRRSIPASAGNPSRPGAPARSTRVHPRERGESVQGRNGRELAEGPSPRARGIRPSGRDDRHRAGSIPASAGNPPRGFLHPFFLWVHPRERGESWCTSRTCAARRGPSPRARGIRHLHPSGRGVRRSIPASAGNPPARRSRPCRGRVHPRERGESQSFFSSRQRASGPSPRARGIRRRRAPPARGGGSIPASAGNPAAAASAWCRRRVHPRERGESSAIKRTLGHTTGPSPRARGIPRR